MTNGLNPSLLYRYRRVSIREISSDVDDRWVELGRGVAASGGRPSQPTPRATPTSALRHFGKQFTHLLAILLWVASSLALLAGQPPLVAAMLW
jgi:hypothetical protein